ncbi:MAG: dTDP-4-dehydrorhamnose reductase [Bacteroidetes bacterium CG2_30_33_31]|nr:MAG: dTDP-4-dehydrorhamnose reductase [Bacteroidetes bacterium CG2_30_33_31]
MNILITGGNGQLGSEIKSLSTFFNEDNFIFTDVAQLDITNASMIDDFVVQNKINVLINCAAYTAVDKAETEKELATLINVEAVKNLAVACKNHKILLIHISTDYVFGGDNYRPYIESDQKKPQSVYANTKLQAELIVEKFASKALIFRTSWLYSEYGNNFVKTMIKYGKERKSLNVVFDQIGTPTYAYDLAWNILNIIPKVINNEQVDIYNFSNEGVCSWYDFALAIMEEAKIDCKINPILSKDYPLPASRPFYSVLDKSKIKTTFAIEIPHWRFSLRECIKKLN